MNDLTTSLAGRTGANAGLQKQAQDIEKPQEAAEQFEKLLLKQMVSVMTEDLMQSPLSGESGPGWMNTQRSHHQSAFSDMLANELAKSSSFNLSEVLMRRWEEGGLIDSNTNADQEDTNKP